MTTKKGNLCIGVDVGRGYTKTAARLQSSRIASIGGDAVEVGYKSVVAGDAGGMIFENERGRFFVGDLARKQSRVLNQPMGPEPQMEVNQA